MPRTNFATQIGNAGIHFIILTTFWIVLYDKLAFDLGRNALKGQVSNAVQQLGTIGDQSLPFLRQVKVDPSMYSTDLSEKSQEKNRKNMTHLIYIILSVAIGLFVLKSQCKGSIRWGDIVKENLILFAGVGAIEYWFFTHIAQHFAPILPSEVTENTKERLLEYGHC